MTHPDMSWFESAACSEMGNRRFFSHDPSKQNIAKFTCSLCPVRRECLQYAMKFPYMKGIWGGLTEKERRSLRRRIQEKKRLEFLYEEEAG